MARKRPGPDALTPQQILAARIRAFQTGQRRPNAALDALTGKRAVEDLAAETPPETPPPPGAGAEPVRGAVSGGSVLLRRLPPAGPTLAGAAPAAAPTDLAGPSAASGVATGAADGGPGRAKVAGYTVYLGPADVETLSFLVDHLARSAGVHPSRSELIRMSIRALRAVVEHVESAAGTLPTAITGENRASDTTE